MAFVTSKVSSTPPVSKTTKVMSEDDVIEKDTDEDSVLTPIRAHYLKKTLISLQFANELSGLTQVSPNPAVSPLSYLGLPFTPPPKDAPVMDFPFVRFMFRQFVLTFPFLASAPKDFFSQKVQPFISSMLSRNLSALSPFDEEATEAEQATREKILTKIEKQFSILLSPAAKLVENEEVVRLTQEDLQRLETIAQRRRARMFKNRDSFDVNIIGVRTVTDKGRVRSKAHEEFIIRTRQAHQPDIFVSRRYGDFKTLSDELRKTYTDLPIPSPPAKDRSTVAAPVTPITPYTPHSQSLSDSNEALSPINRPETFNSDDIHNSPSYSSVSAARLSREKNRLTLRAYLNTLLSSSKIASSPILRSFLTSGAIRLSPAEIEDARRREEADQVREAGRKRFAKELAVKVDALRDAMKSVKRDVMSKDGLLNAFSIIKSTPDVRNLPPDFKAVLEWARISLASTIFHHFVASDSASESFASLKRFHGLMPYFVLKGILKISNPVAMIRGILDLFLAHPFGGRSLLQRMFTSSLAEEVKALQEDIEAVRDKVEDPVLCEKIRLFVYAPSEIQEMFKADAVEEKFDIITVVLRSSEEPKLSRAQLHRIARAHRAHAEYKRYKDSLADSDDDDGPQNDDAWLYEDLNILGKLYTRLRDRQQLMELIFEGTTADLLKDIITIFYAPLAQVYKAASIADSLSDLQNFINDLIRTVEQAEGNGDPASTVNIFVELVQRHEQAFYTFVHKVHSKGAGLFDDLLRWIELFLNFIREGLAEPISLEFLLPHTGNERLEILREVDAVALYHYRLKVAHETKVRRRFDRGEGFSSNGGRQMTADEEDQATQALIDDAVRDLNFGDLVHGEVEEFDADDSSSSEEESSDYESSDEADSVSDLEESETAQILRPMAPQSPAIKRAPPSAPLPQLHMTSARSSFDISLSSTQKPNEPKLPGRKRSFSFKLNKSASDLRQVSKLETPPPVPPLPLHVPLTPQVKTPVTPIPVVYNPSTLPGSFPPNASSSRSVQRRKTIDGLKFLSLNIPHSADHPRRAISPPLPKRKRKQKKQGLGIDPPELRNIPGLLPLFVEVLRPQLRVRQV